MVFWITRYRNNMAKRIDIIACARTYLGTPFQHQGRLKGRGLDCIGLIICVAKEFGLAVPNYANYGPEPTDDTVRRECRKHLREISVEQMRPGDIVCMDVGGRSSMPSHLAIVSSLPPSIGMVHAYSWAGKVVEHDMDNAWRARIAAVFQFPGIED